MACWNPCTSSIRHIVPILRTILPPASAIAGRKVSAAKLPPPARTHSALFGRRGPRRYPHCYTLAIAGRRGETAHDTDRSTSATRLRRKMIRGIRAGEYPAPRCRRKNDCDTAHNAEKRRELNWHTPARIDCSSGDPKRGAGFVHVRRATMKCMKLSQMNIHSIEYWIMV